MRKSTLFLLVVAFQVMLLLAAGVHGISRQRAGRQRIGDESSIVRQLGLTDLCLFTEARYTRHPSQADLNTAFQDHPLSFEHFPSGSLVNPPMPREPHATVD